MAGLGRNLGTSESLLARLARMGQMDRLVQMALLAWKAHLELAYLGLEALECGHLGRLELG